MTPSISAIIPVYNRFELLKRAVESVLAQTYPLHEIILIDDGSTDDTPRLLPKHIEETPSWRGRVRYLYQENQGQSAAYNRGIAEAKGEWLAFNNDDDLWLPQKLEWQFRALDEFNGQCAVCFSDAFFMNNTRMKMTAFQLAGRRHDEERGMISDPLEYVLGLKAKRNVTAVWLPTVVARTDLVRRVGGFDPRLRYSEDHDLLLRLACQTRFCFVSMPAALFDRSPPEQRHLGASKAWDNAGYVLSMEQYRFEKMLRLSGGLRPEVAWAARRGLSAVHSGWANIHLQNRDYRKAREAVARAASYSLTPGVALKWALTRVAPSLARKAAAMRQ